VVRCLGNAPSDSVESRFTVCFASLTRYHPIKKPPSFGGFSKSVCVFVLC